jgi:DNA-directed RNA polymerase subunit RPC12/RpoP
MGPFVWVVLVAAAVLLAAGGYVWLRARRAPTEAVYHFNCPNCGQRFRYQAKQAGRPGQCPRCRKQLNFPDRPS